MTKYDDKCALPQGQEQQEQQQQFQLMKPQAKPILDFKGSRANKMPSPENFKGSKTNLNNQQDKHTHQSQEIKKQIVVINDNTQNKVHPNSSKSPILLIPLSGNKRTYEQSQSQQSSESFLERTDVIQKKLKENENVEAPNQQSIMIEEDSLEVSQISICSQNCEGVVGNEDNKCSQQMIIQEEDHKIEQKLEFQPEEHHQDCILIATTEHRESLKSHNISNHNSNSDNDSEKSDSSEIKRRKAIKFRHLIHSQLTEIESKRKQILEISSIIEKELHPELLNLLKQSAKRQTELVFSEKSTMKLLHHTLSENLSFIHNKLKI